MFELVLQCCVGDRARKAVRHRDTPRRVPCAASRAARALVLAADAHGAALPRAPRIRGGGTGHRPPGPCVRALHGRSGTQPRALLLRRGRRRRGQHEAHPCSDAGAHRSRRAAPAVVARSAARHARNTAHHHQNGVHPPAENAPRPRHHGALGRRVRHGACCGREFADARDAARCGPRIRRTARVLREPGQPTRRLRGVVPGLHGLHGERGTRVLPRAFAAKRATSSSATNTPSRA